MQDLSDVLARCLDEIEENDYSVDEVVEAYPSDSVELKSLLTVADRIRKARVTEDVSAEIKSRSRRGFFRRFK